MSENLNAAALIEMTVDIVSAYLAKNTVAVADVPGVITMIHGALMGVGSGVTPQAPADPPQPAVPVKKSLNPDFLICLEDGRRFKSLKRHLRSAFDMTPEEYRTKWGLPKNYPMVAPNYAARRSVLAKSLGLGSGGRGGRPTAKRVP